MSVGLPAAGEPIGLVDRLLWGGLGCSLLALALVASLERPQVLGYAAFGPEDLKAWAAAVAAAAGSISTAVGASILAGRKLAQFVRWLSGRGRRRKARRKAKPDAPTTPPGAA